VGISKGNSDIHVTVLQEVTGREDSESYAKRTITEIETCLGFTFHGAGAEDEPPEAISNNELEASFKLELLCLQSSTVHDTVAACIPAT
jgi:hypothetical protein